ncbi:MAG: trypsin-like peptidase domain-containing protein [Peptostreptococcaceae bacterium]|jgi:serine protease Do|nr:trypsin-like peptidase domain-containing protein [Peptostreptococcaceae bacterium]
MDDNKMNDDILEDGTKTNTNEEEINAQVNENEDLNNKLNNQNEAIIYNDLKNDESYSNINNEKKTKKDNKFKKTLALVIVGAMVFGSSIGVGIEGFKYYFNSRDDYNVYLESNSNNDVEYENVSTSDYKSPIVKVAKNAESSVVSITNNSVSYDFFDNQYLSTELGSGVIFNISDEKIFILTNYHVVEDSKKLAVSLKEKNYDAEFVGGDKESDLAVISLDQKNIPNDVSSMLKPMKFGDSDKLQIGETAIAIGNPLGYSNTVTVGVVSAVNRKISLPDKSLEVIQTDAAINPGNSGGALTNINGELIGINTVKIADKQVEGIGFAIPINKVKPIVEELLKKGYVSRPFLGIVGQDISENLSQVYDLPIGVLIRSVSQNSPAYNSGIQKGDIIIEFDNEKIMDMKDLTSQIAKNEVGDKVDIVIVRKGQRKELKIRLEDKNEFYK